jgi:hypothetical protein
MNRFLLLVLIAGLTFLVILFAARPDLWDKFLLWFVGLAGVIVRLVSVVVNRLRKLFGRSSPSRTTRELAFEQQRTKNIDESVG